VTEIRPAYREDILPLFNQRKQSQSIIFPSCGVMSLGTLFFKNRYDRQKRIGVGQYKVIENG